MPLNNPVNVKFKSDQLPRSFVGTEALQVMVPEWFLRIEDFIELYKTEEIEFDRLVDHIANEVANLFFDYMDEDAVEKYEKFLNIPVNSLLSLTERRRAVKILWILNNLMTTPRLKEIFDEFVSGGPMDVTWEILKEWDDVLFTRFINADLSLAKLFRVQLRKIIPAHVELIFELIMRPFECITEFYLAGIPELHPELHATPYTKHLDMEPYRHSQFEGRMYGQLERWTAKWSVV
jgi:hypothetical protein